jgi:heme/copper-type cytochrome/quinol oxidase subunit 2
MFSHIARIARLVAVTFGLAAVDLLPQAFAQSSQVDLEWALFNQILMIGIAVGIVVFGLLFYAVIRYREKPSKPDDKNKLGAK